MGLEEFWLHRPQRQNDLGLEQGVFFSRAPNMAIALLASL